MRREINQTAEVTFRNTRHASSCSRQFPLISRCVSGNLGIMRLLIEGVIIAALIFFGWNKPFKDWADQANRKVTSTLDSWGGSLQKNEDPSVKRY
jgi:hypothetical protein